ncbi:pirin family protein [Ferribacterium limneticum]|uniref:pirin family protein n=1 Tax=Ferribacterium limneticum TaxID=76259 RepID=UPI001CF98989|nr:pirin family protein [Ferribacterium limneticum]UCV17851.1 pirin family protein [Ferribacterium limneticum]
MDKGAVFRAFTLRGDEASWPIDPFLGVDHAWISGPTFPPHPHAGFSAVSYLFSDSDTNIANRDSYGDKSLILPGGLHWTAAGRGVVHEEVPAENGKTVHMLQIFVNLPAERQSDAPFALKLLPQEVPVVQMPGVKVRVPLGAFQEACSPLKPPTEVNLFDIELEEGSELLLPIAAGHSAFLMPIFGTVTIEGQAFSSDETGVPAFPGQPEPRVITVKSPKGGAKVVLFSGKPLEQPIYWMGPMATCSEKTLAASVDAYRRGEFGSL